MNMHTLSSIQKQQKSAHTETRLMKKISEIIVSICLISLSITSVTTAQSTEARNLANPQLGMIGSRSESLGGTHPGLDNEVSAQLINPASVGTTKTIPISYSSKILLEDFETNLFNTAFPYEISIPLSDRVHQQPVVIGLNYGNTTLRGIPETTSNNARHFQTTSYDSGFRVLSATLATAFYNTVGLDSLSLGLGIKRIEQFISDDTRSGLGFDLGVQGKKVIQHKYIDSAAFGVSFINFIPTTLEWENTQEQGVLPFEIIFGGSMDLFDEKLSVFAHNSTHGINVGSEVSLSETFRLRGAIDSERISLGTGLILGNIPGIGYTDYNLRFDYAYTINSFPFEESPNHNWSVSILGESRPDRPVILKPFDTIYIAEQRVNLSGIGPRNTTIRVYNNLSLIRTTITDRYGNWAVTDFPLKEGKNTIYIASFTIENGISDESEPVVVYSDTQPPKLNVSVIPIENRLLIKVKTSDVLQNIDGEIETIKLNFTKQTTSDSGEEWLANIKMPQYIASGAVAPSAFLNLVLFAQDRVGNQTFVDNFPFFLSLQHPSDKTVHYKPELRFIGRISDSVSRLTVNGLPVYIDPENRFAINAPLEVGKNLIKVQVSPLEGSPINYYIRALRLKTFNDIENVKQKQEIQLLATLGVLLGDDDTTFGPQKPVTKEYIAKLMVHALDLDIEQEVESALFTDVPATHPTAPYIKAAIENGLMFANLDGTFGPDEELSLSEIVYFLSTAQIISDQELEVNPPIVLRGELAQFLAFSPKYELQIERLIDWNRGYTP